MDKNKLYIGISFVTKIIWEVVLVRLEFYLMKLEQELGALSYLAGDLKVPLLVHGVLILTAASLMLGLWVQWGEVKKLYGSDIQKIKGKIHQATSGTEDEK